MSPGRDLPGHRPGHPSRKRTPESEAGTRPICVGRPAHTTGGAQCRAKTQDPLFKILQDSEVARAQRHAKRGAWSCEPGGTGRSHAHGDRQLLRGPFPWNFTAVSVYSSLCEVQPVSHKGHVFKWKLRGGGRVLVAPWAGLSGGWLGTSHQVAVPGTARAHPGGTDLVGRQGLPGSRGHINQGVAEEPFQQHSPPPMWTGTDSSGGCT